MISGRRILVITGVPGTGKTTFSKSLARKIKNSEVIHVSDVIKRYKLSSSRSKDGSKIVKMKKLQRRLDLLVGKSSKQVVIVESHLLCDIKLKGALAIVLREHLPIIKKRLEQRAYGNDKIKTNLISEATDYCGIRAGENYPYVFESFARDKKLMGNVMKVIKGRRLRQAEIDLLPELRKMLKERAKSVI